MSWIVNKIAEEAGEKVENAVKKTFGVKDKGKEEKKGGGIKSWFGGEKEEEKKKKGGGIFSFGDDEKEKEKKKGGLIPNIFHNDKHRGEDDGAIKKVGFDGLFSEGGAEGGREEGGGGGEEGENEATTMHDIDGDLLNDLMEVAEETSGNRNP